MTRNTERDVVVIGGSAGAVEAASTMPGGSSATIVVIIHLLRRRRSTLAEVHDEEPLAPGAVYVALLAALAGSGVL